MGDVNLEGDCGDSKEPCCKGRVLLSSEAV